MAAADGSRIVAIEEHYFDPELAALFAGRDDRMPPPIRERLLDVGEMRLAEMDAAGIDVQVLSHGAPATQKLDSASAAEIARGVNDRLAGIVAAAPDRFQGFAALPTPDPAAAADELDRCVSELGFKGAMVHGLTHGAFLDEKRFWPIFERAAALGVPVYMHPSIPHEDVIQAYYADYIGEFPGLLTAGWGFTVETATQGIRLVLSGVFDACPDLKIILGHLGEGLPFLLWRIDQALSRTESRLASFRETFREHFYITTSGNFSDPALLCSAMEMGTDRILFSVDYPFVASRDGTDWMARIPFSTEDRRKILHGNAERLLGV
ncbi:MAG: amidohydrolase family protein [Defluviicoccus sp.]|nr:amidohydrolase family protein [Defluviicoccus sp.]MDE0384056.1 amidohydrolase family protein [Defluviicoccus sp.]